VSEWQNEKQDNCTFVDLGKLEGLKKALILSKEYLQSEDGSLVVYVGDSILSDELVDDKVSIDLDCDHQTMTTEIGTLLDSQINLERCS
jgi:dTDP-glucose pyrophosphorylase